MRSAVALLTSVRGVHDLAGELGLLGPAGRAAWRAYFGRIPSAA